MNACPRLEEAFEIRVQETMRRRDASTEVPALEWSSLDILRLAQRRARELALKISMGRKPAETNE
jgi:hypothetical protein